MNTIRFGETDIRCVVTDDNTWVCGRDICEVLGYSTNSNISKILSKISPNFKKSLSELVPETAHHDGLAIYLNKDGLSHFLTRSRTLQAALVSQKLVEFFELDVKIIDHSKEQVWIGALLKAFECETIEPQFNIGSYRIDLYFPDYKIAVECDEFGHSDRTQSEEIGRQLYIENRLSCDFVRFNPDAKDFDIFQVIGRINRMIKNQRIN